LRGAFVDKKRMKVPSRKTTTTARNLSKLPLWLRRLERVKAELKGTRFPRTAEEGFRQCMMLSTTALRWLRDSIKDNHPEASEEQLEAERRACSQNYPLPKAAGWPSGGRSEYAISDDDLAIVLRQVVECLRRARVRYAIIGAWALSLWGKPRATADLDFLVSVNDQDLKRLTAFMTAAGMSVDEVWQEWNPLLRGSQLRFQCRGVTIDFLCPRDRHDQDIFRRRKRSESREANTRWCLWRISSYRS
jgi:hypothetical protein